MNVLLTISYVGTKYHGFQIQNNAPTVQQAFQNALWTIFPAKPDIKGCSRTDAGVHARRYGISFSTDKEMELWKLVDALNNLLPRDIRVLAARKVSDEFHARYSCLGKRYKYVICDDRAMDPFLNGFAHHNKLRLNESELNRVAQLYIGTHDFRSFAGTKLSVEDTVRTIYSASVVREGNTVCFYVSGDGFLYNMVRIMVGTLLSYARGKISEQGIIDAVNGASRTNAMQTAPAEGLFLDSVIYDFGEL